MERGILSRCPATRWPRRAALGCLAVLLVALPGCTTSRGVSDATAAAEADLYSGLPNPVWRLGPGTTHELGSMLRALQPGGTPADAPGLGYRGLVVRGLEEVLRRRLGAGSAQAGR